MLDALGRVVAQLLKWALILAGATMVGGFLWRIRGLFGCRRPGDSALEPPSTLFGLELRPESIPKDVEGVARALLQEGRFRAALALLYRASLSRLVGGYGLELSAGATEGECLRLAARVLPPASSTYFRDLTRAWQAAAYAHLPPLDGEALCLRWSAVFARAE